LHYWLGFTRRRLGAGAEPVMRRAQLLLGELGKARRGAELPRAPIHGDYKLGNEYSHATRRLAAVRWSRGLRATMLGPSEASEKTDLELAADDANGELVTRLSAAGWSAIRLAGLDLALLAVAENGGGSAVQSVVADACPTRHASID
jgi:hypothetical protein